MQPPSPGLVPDGGDLSPLEDALREAGRQAAVLFSAHHRSVMGQHKCSCNVVAVASGGPHCHRCRMAEAALQELPGDQHASPKYQLIKALGRGSFGFVCLCHNTQTQELSAIKFLPRAEVTKYVEAEIVNHSLMRHPHVVQFREVFLTSKFICIAMEYAGAGSLHAYVKQQGHLKEAVARWFFQQLAVAVDYCHKRGVANRDIKLENTLLASVPRLPLPLLKICDFGYSKQENKSAAKSKVGTLTYMAPEVLLNVTRDGRYDGKVADIWSCGVMLYVMLTGRYPFDSPNKTGNISMPNDFILMLEQMVARRYTIPPELGLSEDCCNLLRRMLMPEPHKRIAMADILAHRWFNTNLPPDVVHMNAKYLGLPRLAGVPSPAAIQELLDAAHTPTATGSSSGEPGRGSGGSDSGGGGTSERAVQQQPPGDGAAARMPPPEHMQMSATHEALGGSAPAVAAATPPGGGRQQQQQQQLMGSSGPDSASACGVMEVDASIPSNEGLPSLPHEMSHELQAYVKASEAGWS